MRASTFVKRRNYTVMLVTDEIYSKVLLRPPEKEGLNNLYIVSGYATSAMSFHHLSELHEKYRDINIHLIVGMTAKDGISKSNHEGFKSIVSGEYAGRFECRYVCRESFVHSKVYVWCADSAPKVAFLGSANYTQTAFLFGGQEELLAPCNPEEGLDYFHSIISQTEHCNYADIHRLITIYRRRQEEYSEDEVEGISGYEGLQHASVSLLGRDNNLPERSGLNWGQRPEANREPNQAYIRLTADVYKSDFFPPVGTHFTLLTDDEKTLICSRAQQNGKAVHTPHNNSLIGEYFRNRLGVPNGARITKSHLVNYGRTNLAFYKIDNETYYMDFSV